VLVLASAAVALVATLVIGNLSPQAGECAVQPVAAKAIDAAATGELAALNGTGTGRGYATMSFEDASGAKKTIADFAGRKLLVNFWASWCVPCRAEMPALDRLAAKYNSDFFTVLPVNLDIGAGAVDKAKAFLAEGGFQNLPLYADPTFNAFEMLKQKAVAAGLPATLLLDEKGCELGVLQGPAEWDTPDGDKVIEALLGA
jgi:thiol-disulfide isomerase/thioredoxin